MNGFKVAFIFVAACLQMLVGGVLLAVAVLLFSTEYVTLAGILLLAGVSCVYSGVVITENHLA